MAQKGWKLIIVFALDFMGASGFPNYKLDAVVKEALLPLPDTFKHSEERRLLYKKILHAHGIKAI